MKTFTPTLALITLLLVAACHRRPIEAPNVSYQPPPVTDPAVLRATAELRTSLKAEYERRIRAEAQLTKEKGDKSFWQLMAALSIGAGVILLVLGAIAGSQATRSEERRVGKEC